jgi:hypothetical protein
MRTLVTGGIRVRIPTGPARIGNGNRTAPFDGFAGHGSEILRGEPLAEAKLRAVEALGQHGIRAVLVTTLQPGVNDHEIGAIVKFGLERPWITGIRFQPATYSGRHVLPADLESRITFPEVIKAIAAQRDGIHHVLPSGHVIPFCAYNVLYREGHVPLPTLEGMQAAGRTQTLPTTSAQPLPRPARQALHHRLSFRHRVHPPGTAALARSYLLSMGGPPIRSGFRTVVVA